MKNIFKLFLILLAMMFITSCASMRTKSLSSDKLEELSQKGESIDVDVDDNDKLDTTYGGTNLDSSSVTGVVNIFSGVWSVRSSVPYELYPAALSDTSSPHALLISECRNKIISTEGWNGTDDIEFDLPDISAYTSSSEPLAVLFLDKVGMQDTDADLYIDPDSSTQIILDLTITGTDGDAIWNDNTGIWEGIYCRTTWTTALGGVWKCDTVGGTFLDKGGDAP